MDEKKSVNIFFYSFIRQIIQFYYLCSNTHDTLLVISAEFQFLFYDSCFCACVYVWQENYQVANIVTG